MSTNQQNELLANVKNVVASGTFSARQPREQLYTNPVKYSIPALLSVSGNPSEVNNYFYSTPDNLSDFKKVLKGNLYQTAYQIFNHHPKVSTFALNHKAIKSKINNGPIERLPYTDKVTRVLGLLMVDFKNFLWLKKNGYLNWDDGTYEACMAITYGWRRVLPDKVKLTQSHTDVHFETRSYLKSLAVQYPNQPLVRFVLERYQMAWYYKNQQQINKTKDYFEKLSKTRATNDTAKTLKILGASSLADMALRYRQPKILEKALKDIDKQIPKKTVKESTALIWAETQLKLQKGDTASAKKLTDKLYKNSDAYFKKESAFIYEKLGETKKAKRIINKYKTN